MVTKVQDQEEIIEINGCKYRVSYYIHMKYMPKIAKYLKENDVPFKAGRMISLIPDNEEEDELEDTHYVPIEEDLSNKLYQISKITGISVKEIVDDELGALLADHMRENPIIFLDAYLGIKTIKDPISMVRALKPIINIPDDYMKEIENTDPMFYINQYNPYKYNKNVRK